MGWFIGLFASASVSVANGIACEPSPDGCEGSTKMPHVGSTGMPLWCGSHAGETPVEALVADMDADVAPIPPAPPPPLSAVHTYPSGHVSSSPQAPSVRAATAAAKRSGPSAHQRKRNG